MRSCRYPESEFIAIPDLPGAVEGLAAELGTDINPSDSEATIILNHTPVDFQKNADAGADVQLSGHTHGGHIFPFHVFTATYDGTSGLFETTVEGAKRSFLYVSEGAVGWGPRVRLFSRPEVTIMTLTADPSDDTEPSGNVGTTMGQFFVYVSIAIMPPTFLLLGWSCWLARKKRSVAAAKKERG